MGNKHYKNKTGLFSLTEEQKLENCRKYGKIGGAVVDEKYSRSFTLVSPTGEIVTGKNLTKFCRDNNLTRANIQMIIKGQRSQHKGWRSV